MMGVWGDKHAGAEEVLLFTEGDLGSSHDLLIALGAKSDKGMKQVGAIEPKGLGIRVVGFFI